MADSVEIVDSEGEVIAFSAEMLARLPSFAVVDLPGRGRGAQLAALIPDDMRTEGAALVLVGSGGFSARVPLDAVLDVAVIQFESGGRPLHREDGGPFRFVVPDAAACRSADVNRCANVKGLVRIEVAGG